jgi:hypothetical protein
MVLMTIKVNMNESCVDIDAYSDISRGSQPGEVVMANKIQEAIEKYLAKYTLYKEYGDDSTKKD